METELTKEYPLVSIVIPVYNGSNYMRDAIDSALGQTYPNIEVLVVNDGSSDGGKTAEIARSYGDRIRYFEKPNGGVSSALNLGIREMRGEYFSWLSHDDKYDDQKIETQVNQLLGTSKTVSLCRSVFIDTNNHIMKPPTERDSYAVKGWNDALITVLQNCPAGCSFLLPANVFEVCGGFNEELRYCQDKLMWSVMFLHEYSLAYCEYVGVFYRMHPQQVTQTSSHLYHSDSNLISSYLIPPLAEKSNKEYNFLYYYAKGEAIHGNNCVVNQAISAANEKSLFSAGDKLRLRVLSAYGKIRPGIRRLYYRIRKLHGTPVQ